MTYALNIPQERFIIAARRALDMSRAELAKEAGVSVSMLGDWETGKHEPHFNNRKAVMRVLGARGVQFLVDADGLIQGLRWPT